jgi:hypothetical protein
MNTRTQALFAAYPKMVEERTITDDPETVTPGIKDATVVDQMAWWNDSQWGLPGVHANDITHSAYIFGDYDATTIPGNNTEYGGGINKFTELAEDFSQTKFVSNLDDKPIGSLIWNDAQNEAYNSAAAFQQVMDAYAKMAQSWKVDLALSGSNGTNMSCTFGGNPNATNAYDGGIDVISPPIPQTYYAYFSISAFPLYLSTDIRGWTSPFDQDLDWTLKVVNAEEISTTITWNPANLPSQGNFTITGAGSVNMRTTGTFGFTGNKTLTIQYRLATTVSYAFTQAGWYMVSLPVLPADSSVATLFPTALGGMAFGWDPAGTYTPETKMKPKKGYWIAIPGPATANVTGLPLNGYTEHFSAQGWYMIGSVLGSVNFSDPNDNPNGQVLSPAFGWNSGTGVYVPSTTLNEKEGYWVAVFNACDLTVGGTGGESPAPLAKADWEAFYARFGKTPPMPPVVDGKTGKAMELPKTYGLFQNYPNPFNPETTIRYQIPDAVHVSLIIYNMMGQAVKKLVDSQQNAGYYEAVWNGKDKGGLSLGSGMYVVRIEAGKFSSMRKIVMIR